MLFPSIGIGLILTSAEAVTQKVSRDAEQPSRRGNIVAGLLQRASNEHRHGIIQHKALRRETKIRIQPFGVRDRFVWIDGRLQLLQVQFRAALEDDRAFQFVRQFADITRPRAGRDPLAGALRQSLDRHAMPSAEAFQQEFREADDIAATFAQRGNLNAIEIEPVKQILAEFSAATNSLMS